MENIRASQLPSGKGGVPPWTHCQLISGPRRETSNRFYSNWPHTHDVSGLCEEAAGAATSRTAAPPCPSPFGVFPLQHVSCSQVGFAHPGVAATVMVYLASDGSWSGEQCRRTVTILLSDTTGKNHSLGASSGPPAAFSHDPKDCVKTRLWH